MADPYLPPGCRQADIDGNECHECGCPISSGTLCQECRWAAEEEQEAERWDGQD